MVDPPKTFQQMSNPPRVNPRPFPFLFRFSRLTDLTDVPFVSIIPDLKTTLDNTKHGIFSNKAIGKKRPWQFTKTPTRAHFSNGAQFQNSQYFLKYDFYIFTVFPNIFFVILKYVQQSFDQI